MNEEEKKALKVINARTRRLLDELEIEKEDMSDEPRIAYLMQEIRANKTILNLIEKLQKENEKLKNIRYDTPYGTETIHLIPESDLIEINTQKYMIEVKPGKFVDLKQVYQENKILNEYKGNYIPIQIIEDFIKKYQKLSDEFYEKFLETNKTDIDIHDAGISCDAKVQVLQELLEGEE